MLTPGTRLGPYDVQAPLGSGGMGEVYRARDTRLDRTVAIKILSPLVADSPNSRARFEHEARAISQLNHPNICTLYDIGEAPAANATDPPMLYLVMEFVDGETLSDVLSRGRLPLHRALSYASQIADALDKAHRKGIVHGDLKPGNVMVTKGGVKLLDFGLARQRRPAPGPDWSEAATRTMPIQSPGTVLGTLQYLAPEQLEGKEADERTDIFACGAVIYEMVIGRRAFEGEMAATVIAAIMRRERPSIASVLPLSPASLDHLVTSCLAIDPDERWQHAGDLARELTWLTRADSAAVDAARPPRRRAVAWIAAATVLCVLALLAGVAYLLRPAPTPVIYRTSLLLPSGLRFPEGGALAGVGRFAISPDGRRIAFVATDTSGNQMLWVRALDSLMPTVVPGTDGASSPFWSPDSRLVAFVAQMQLKVIDPNGGAPPVVVAEPAFSNAGTWGRDGTIVFSQGPVSPLFRVAASGGQARPVTPSEEGSTADVQLRNPFFLPDGRHFLYASARTAGTAGVAGLASAGRAIYIGSLQRDERPKLLIDGGSSAKYADGYLLFLRETTLFAQAFDPDRLTLSGEPQPIAEQVAVNVASVPFSVSDTGLLAFQSANARGAQLAWFDRQGRQLGTVGEPADYGDLELSPDGRRAAVSILDTSVNTRDIWIVDVARGVRTRFTFDRADDGAPVWSPDGTRILFSSDRTGHLDLYEKASSGLGNERLVLADAWDKFATSWSADDRSALYWTFDTTGSSLWILPLVGPREPKRFLASPVSPGRLSPDGRWVAYYSSESGRQEVYVVPFPVASRKSQVSDAGGSLSRWGRNGKAIYYLGRDSRLMMVNVAPKDGDLDVSRPVALFDVRLSGPRYSYDIAPDGDRFLVVSAQVENLSSSISLVQNWRAALGRP